MGCPGASQARTAVLQRGADIPGRPLDGGQAADDRSDRAVLGGSLACHCEVPRIFGGLGSVQILPARQGRLLAGLVVGTSSGATAAAQVRSGMPPAELLAAVLSPPAQPAGQSRERPPSLPMATVSERMRAIGAAATSAAGLRRAMGAFGLESDAALGPRRDSTGRHRDGARTRPASSRACTGHRNGAWTWQARSRPCASRAATSR